MEHGPSRAESTRDATLARFASPLSFGVAFGLSAVLLQWGVWVVFSPFGLGTSYGLGAWLGLGTHVLLGSLIALPLLSKRARLVRAVVAVLSALAFAALAASYHYHAAFNRMPSQSSLASLREPGMLWRSLWEALPPLVWLIEALVPTALALALARFGSARLVALRAHARGIAAAIALLMVGSLAVPSVLEGQTYYGAVHPFVHFLSKREPAVQMPDANADKGASIAVAFEIVRSRLTPTDAAGGRGRELPYCRTQQKTAAPHAARASSAILLLLEGISNRELHGSYQGKPLMPELSRIAGEGLSFRRFQSVGDRSSQALFSLLAGVPAETHRRVVTHSRLVRFQGFPKALRDAGFATHYLHGSDLSFEQQRALVRRAGFEHVLEPEPSALEHVRGWGLSDRAMFAQLQRTVTSARNADTTRPYFALLATLSSHDPYFVPADHTRVFSGNDSYTRFAETVRYLDAELARFYRFYVQREQPQGTLLAIVSDHAPRVTSPSDPKQTATGEFEYRFEIPFMLFGSAIEALPAREQLRERPGDHADVGATLLDLLGVAKPDCMFGISLLDPSFPAQRATVSIAGDNLEYMFVNVPPLRYLFPLDGRPAKLHDLDRDPLLRTDLLQKDAQWNDVRTLVDAYLRLGAYLNLGDHFAPEVAAPESRTSPSGHPDEPMLVISHRGNTDGASAASAPPENTFAAFDRAIERGFSWIEVDVQLTADSVPVLHHDPVVRAPDGEKVELLRFTHAQLRERGLELPSLPELFARYAGKAHFAVELKSQASWLESTRLTRAALAAIAERPEGMRIVVDSFSHGIATSVRRWSDVEVGWDAPQRPFSREWLDLLREHGLHWIYLRHDLATKEAIAELHALGAKVMLYTLDDPSALARFGEHPPDGVITDSAALLQMAE